jgi:hypothetical protein
MTAAVREQVRAARDRAVRAAIDWTAEPRCAGCGVEQSDPWTGEPRYVAGCRTCTDRRLRRSYRASIVREPAKPSPDRQQLQLIAA